MCVCVQGLFQDFAQGGVKWLTINFKGGHETRTYINIILLAHTYYSNFKILRGGQDSSKGGPPTLNSDVY